MYIYIYICAIYIYTIYIPYASSLTNNKSYGKNISITTLEP